MMILFFRNPESLASKRPRNENIKSKQQDQIDRRRYFATTMSYASNIFLQRAK